MSGSPISCEHCGAEHPAETQRCPRVGRIFKPERFYPLGTLIGGKYRIERVLGSGGMAAVFQATHTLLRKDVAVKLLMPGMVRNEKVVARMVREARAASAIEHANIAQVTDMGLTEQRALYLVMELVEGKTLSQLLRRRERLSWREAVVLIDQVLAGLGAVHARGIVHRDLKPDNVMIERPESAPVAKILDFGIAKALQEEGALALTNKGQILGTPRHMAPEQAMGGEVDARTDLFAVGALLYQLLAGRPAIAGDTLEQVIANVRNARVVPLGQLVPELPEELEAIVARALAADPDARFADARAFRDALALFLPASRRRQPSVALATLADKEGDSALAPTATLERRQQYLPDQPEQQTEGRARAKAEEGGARWASLEGVPAEEQSLKLDLDAVRPRRPSVGHIYQPPTFWQRHHRALLIGAAVLGLLLLALTQHARLRVLLGGEREPPPEVLVVIEPHPKRARLSVDGLPHPSLTVRLPRSERIHLLRVEAAGYRSEELRIRANETQLIRVRLKR